MEGVTQDSPIATDAITQRVDLTPENMLEKESIAARHALNVDSQTTSAQETMLAIMERAKKTKHSLDNTIAENERLRRDLALEIAKSKQIVRQVSE